MPDVCIASDFIVGFPARPRRISQQTVDLVRDCRFKNSFIFKYSPRPGTVAIDRFADDVPEDVKRRRNNELLAVQQEVCADNNREMIGKTVEVLVEGESKLVSKPAYPRRAAVSSWAGRSEPRAVADSPNAPNSSVARAAIRSSPSTAIRRSRDNSSMSRSSTREPDAVWSAYRGYGCVAHGVSGT